MLPDKAGFDQKSADTIGYYLYFLPPGGVQVSPRVCTILSELLLLLLLFLLLAYGAEEPYLGSTTNSLSSPITITKADSTPAQFKTKSPLLYLQNPSHP